MCPLHLVADLAASPVASSRAADPEPWSAVVDPGVTHEDVTDEEGIREEEAAALLLEVDEARAYRRAGTFARLALQLFRAAAPRPLVADAHQAAIAEVSRCHRLDALLAELRDRSQSAPPSPFNRAVGDAAPPSEVRAVAAKLVDELEASAVRAQEVFGLVRLSSVREELLRSVEDDRRHAALAARVVAWATAADAAPTRVAAG